MFSSGLRLSVEGLWLKVFVNLVEIFGFRCNTGLRVYGPGYGAGGLGVQDSSFGRGLGFTAMASWSIALNNFKPYLLPKSLHCSSFSFNRSFI